MIAVKDGIIHFIEVKSKVRKGNGLDYRPEENVNGLKVRKLRRIIETYLNERKYGPDARFKFHVIAIITDPSTGKSVIKFMENIIL